MIPTCLKAAMLLAACIASSLMAAADAAPKTSTLATVKSTGTLFCGVIREEEDYSKASVHGNRAAFDADICKAVGLAVIGERAKVIFTTFADEPAALRALQSGKVQIVATATASFSNLTAFHTAFSPVILADGQGFLVNKAFDVKTPADLAGKKVCFIAETTNVEHLEEFAAREHIKLFPFPFEEQGEMEAAMYTANCAAVTSDITQLANTRARYNTRAKDFDILPETIALDPLAVAYQSNDPEWSADVNAVVSAVLQAEENSITAANIEQQRNSAQNPVIASYFGHSGGIAPILHLDPDWAFRVVHTLGNYDEIYERDLGSKSPLQMSRHLSALWSHGGLLYPQIIGSR